MARDYLTSWFLPDLISGFPFRLLSENNFGNASAIKILKGGKALKALRSGTAESQAKHGGAGAVLKPQTQSIVAWNTVERKANTSQHLTYFLHLCSLGTRDWRVHGFESDVRPTPRAPLPW